MKASAPTLASGMTTSSIHGAMGMSTPLESAGIHPLPLSPHFEPKNTVRPGGGPPMHFNTPNAVPHVIHASRA